LGIGCCRWWSAVVVSGDGRFAGKPAPTAGSGSGG
jgi:hypothetical protein